MTKDWIFTYQTKLGLPKDSKEVLAKTAELLSRVERCLFADYAKGKKLHDLKSEYLQKHAITARQFNAVRFQLEGKIQSVTSLQERHIVTTRLLIEKLKKKSSLLRKKQEQIRRLENKLADLVHDKELGKIRVCFGSKKLFHAQFHLEKNGYSSHEEWKKVWTKSRNDSFFTLGSKDESFGNQTCQATVCEDGTLTLMVRLPDALIPEHGKYLIIEGVYFPYGHEAILTALASCKKREQLKREKDPSYAIYGEAISYRFKCRDNDQWHVHASVSVPPSVSCTRLELGAIGLDMNADHIAVVEIDAHGNPVRSKSFPLVTYGKSTDQTEALIGDASAQVVEWAREVGKPIVLEKLDFEKKKEALDETSKSHARMLSSFAYNKTITVVQSRAYRSGVEVISVNPAYTSTIGKVKYAVRYGLTIHESAALCIARRGWGVSEKVPCRLDRIPNGKGGHVALTLPARKRGKHVWSTWRQIHRELLVKLAAYFRAMKEESIRRAAKTKAA